MGFKENLREEMDFQDIKPKELSEKTNISVNTIRNYINGHNALPSIESGVKIAEALGVTVEYLVAERSKKTPKKAVAESEAPYTIESRLSSDSVINPDDLSYKFENIYTKLVEDFKSLSENDRNSVLALIREMKKHY